jgi:serine/threonine protein kinase
MESEYEEEGEEKEGEEDEYDNDNDDWAQNAQDQKQYLPEESASAIARRCGVNQEHEKYKRSSMAPYAVTRRLGHGSIGIVEEVEKREQFGVEQRWDSLVRKQVRIQRYGSSAKSLRRRVMQEVESLESLKHPHIVKVIGTYEEIVDRSTNYYSILMHPVGETDLKSLLDRVGETSMNGNTDEEMSWLQAWPSCLASALAYRHAEGIRHQDIKPANIIHRGPHVFFTDFSSSEHFDLGHTTSTESPAATTRMYRSPEVEAGERHGRGTDVFALGCVFTEMLVVLSGKRVKDFHTKCIKRDGSIGSYGKALTKQTYLLEGWFHFNISEINLRMYFLFVEPMLHLNRKHRPSASHCATHCSVPSSSRHHAHAEGIRDDVVGVRMEVDQSVFNTR